MGLSSDEAVNSLLSGSYWNGEEVTGNPVIVTYSFSSSFPAYDASIDGFTQATQNSFTAFTPDEQAQAVQALNEWSAASGLIFVQVNPGQGDINFQNVDFNTTNGYAGYGGVGFYPFGAQDYNSDPYYYGDLTTAGDVYMNSQYQDSQTGTVSYETLLHEIGHAIGLKHPNEEVYGPTGVDHDQMSPNDPSLTVMATVGDDGGDGTAHLTALDQQTAAFIYGAPVQGSGAVITADASGTNSVSSWSWNAATETLTQTAVSDSEVIRGTSVNDVITAIGGNNELFGLEGNNTLIGAAGDDKLYGGSDPASSTLMEGGGGNDSFYVSSLNDIVQQEAGGSGTVFSYVSFSLPAYVDTLYLYGAGTTGTANNDGDTIYGAANSPNILIGGTGNDYLVGGNQADTIYGGGGIDIMYGGGGADTFVFQSVTDAPVAPDFSPHTTIDDFTENVDQIDLSSIKTTGANPGQSLFFSSDSTFDGQAGEVIGVVDGSTTYVEGDVNGDGVADFDIQLNNVTAPLAAADFYAMCYLPGTRIAAEFGEIAIQDLSIGDKVLTASGALQVIRWIGRRSYAGTFIAKHHLLLPICVRKGALSDNVPHTDLFVSPGHALLVDSQLVPAWRLVNGVSITQASAVDEVTYLHIELAQHDILIANGAMAESFFDDDCRGMFHNAAEFYARHPNEPAKAPYAPRLEDGFGLQRIQRRIAERAGVISPQRATGLLRGFVDKVEPNTIAGWAQDIGNPEAPVTLEITVEGRPIACILANSYRTDLRRLGFGSGCHGFSLVLPDAASGAVSVRRVSDRALLPLTYEAQIPQQHRAA